MGKTPCLSPAPGRSLSPPTDAADMPHGLTLGAAQAGRGLHVHFEATPFAGGFGLGMALGAVGGGGGGQGEDQGGRQEGEAGGGGAHGVRGLG